MYSVGDKVVCPMHGAGVIETIENRVIDGETHQYYIVTLFLGHIQIMVPVNLESSHIRELTNRADAERLIASLPTLQAEENSNWAKRYRENMDKLKSGDIFETAQVLKSLVLRNNEKTLSAGERKMLHSAKQILMSELMISLETDFDTLEREIYNAIG